MDLLDTLNQMTRAAFEAAGYNPDFGTVRFSDRPDLSDFQCNGCMAVAKSQRMNPMAAAEGVMSALDLKDLFTVELTPPGFLNFKVTEAAHLQLARAMQDAPRFFADPVEAPQKFLVDYGGPNLAKEMHVGHLRASLVGQALVNILKFAGHDVVGDVHLGDWGLQIGQLIGFIEDERPDLLSDPDARVSIEDLQEWYPKASARSKESEAFRERARQATSAMQEGAPVYMGLWQRIMEASHASLKRDFARLGVEFDYFYGESRYQEMLGGIVEDLTTAGHAVEDDGAIVIPLPEDQKLPPLILRNSAGGYGYGATDIATIVDRVAEDDPDTMLYVVDGRQKLHFRQVFQAATQCGLAGKAQLEHTAFGTVNGPDGKPFKTRAGGVMRLHDLMTTMHGLAGERIQLGDEVSDEERHAVVETVAMAAIKFGELSHDRESAYVFDMNAFAQFEGKTGPYLQYSTVRLKTLLEKAAAEALTPGEITCINAPAQDLILALSEFALRIDKSIEARKPSVLAGHVYKLAGRANTFYQSCRILGGDLPEDEIASHLALISMTVRQLELGLGLLGIDVPARM
ncbi:MAG: arginine--tRNA ligase [Pseudomonadota bacterium]